MLSNGLLSCWDYFGFPFKFIPNIFSKFSSVFPFEVDWIYGLFFLNMQLSGAVFYLEAFGVTGYTVLAGLDITYALLSDFVFSSGLTTTLIAEVFRWNSNFFGSLEKLGLKVIWEKEPGDFNLLCP